MIVARLAMLDRDEEPGMESDLGDFRFVTAPVVGDRITTFYHGEYRSLITEAIFHSPCLASTDKAPGLTIRVRLTRNDS